MRDCTDPATSRVIHLSFPDDEFDSETVAVLELAPEQFRLLETPVTADPPVYLGDLIEARADSEGVYHFHKVIEQSDLKHFSWLLTHGVIESAAMEEFLSVVRQKGGQWERMLGGFLIVHLPVDSEFDVEKELGTMIARMQTPAGNS